MMKIKLGHLRRIIEEETIDMVPSTSIPDGRSEIWRDQDAAGPTKALSKEQEKAALRQRIVDLKAAQLAAVKRYHELDRMSEAVQTNEGYGDEFGDMLAGPDDGYDFILAKQEFPGAVAKLADLEGFQTNVNRLEKYFDFDKSEDHELIAYQKGTPTMYVWHNDRKEWVEE